jgi:hypothetical protein
MKYQNTDVTNGLAFELQVSRLVFKNKTFEHILLKYFIEISVLLFFNSPVVLFML